MRCRPPQLVRVRGMAPLLATVYELERLRRDLCAATSAARWSRRDGRGSGPAGVGSEKYDETASSMIALLKYGWGFPGIAANVCSKALAFHCRSRRSRRSCATPARRYDAVYSELIRQAADGQVIYIRPSLEAASTRSALLPPLPLPIIEGRTPETLPKLTAKLRWMAKGQCVRDLLHARRSKQQSKRGLQPLLA